MHDELTATDALVSDMLQASYDSMRMVFPGTGVELLVRGADIAGIRVRTDVTRLCEVLDNLLSNSLAHTPAGGRVYLGARVHDTEVEFVIQDEGRGISPDDLPHVLEPFYRGEGGSGGRTPRPGMGLGLAISSRLVEAMGGRLALSSEGLGCGTTASVFLPRV